MLGPKPEIKVGDVVILKELTDDELHQLDVEAQEANWYGNNSCLTGTFSRLQEFLGGYMKASCLASWMPWLLASV